MAKVLTVKNPWAWLIAQGIKDIENRTWKTNFRGRILIHAATQMDSRHRDMSLLFTPDQWDSLDKIETNEINTRKLIQRRMICGTFPKSEILCSVEIVDCVQNHESIWAEKGLSEKGKPIWNWVLRDPQPEPDYEGLKIKGALSFWDFTQDRIIGKEVSSE